MKHNINSKVLILAAAVSLGLATVASAQTTTIDSTAPASSESAASLLGTRYSGLSANYIDLRNHGSPNVARGLTFNYNQPLRPNLDLNASFDYASADLVGGSEAIRRAAEVDAVAYTAFAWGKPFALIGGFSLIYLLGHHLSIASGVGFIALAGVAAEFGVVMLIYLDQSVKRMERAGQLDTRRALKAAIVEGAVMRVRPKAMTVAVIIAGLLPLFWGAGTGSEVMQRIAAPMIGGMITAPLLSMILIPAAYLLLHGRKLRD